MDEWPTDIRVAAEAVIERGYDEGLLDAVCRALMAERERCAKVAEQFDPGAYCESTPQALDDCAASIRRGSS